jgi:hypothetical protein
VSGGKREERAGPPRAVKGFLMVKKKQNELARLSWTPG